MCKMYCGDKDLADQTDEELDATIERLAEDLEFEWDLLLSVCLEDAVDERGFRQNRGTEHALGK